MSQFAHLISEAQQAYGSANAELLGDLVSRLTVALGELQERGTEQASQIQRLKDELEYLRTKVFGTTSERQTSQDEHAQAASVKMSPFDDGDTCSSDEIKQAASEDVGATNTDPDSSTSTAADDAETKKRKRKARKGVNDRQKKQSKATKTSPEVVHEIVRHRLPDDLDLACPLCGELVKDGGLAERSSEIDLAPSRVVTREHILHKGVCGCGSLRFTMPHPVRGVAQTIFSPRFVAQVIVDKFMGHLPCNRQAKLLKLQGLSIHRDRLINLLLKGWVQLEPLVQRIGELNRAEPYQSCDESPVRAIIKGVKETRYLWCLVTNLAITFAMTATRNKAVAREIIGSAVGVLTSDRLSIYRRLFEGKAESGCMAHCRRYFWYALATAGVEAMTIIGIIEDLYAVEREAKDLKLGANERLRLRQEKSLPILDRFKTILSAMDPPPRSRLGQAKTYTLEHWQVLTYFTTDGRVEIDNNHTEAALRVPKLGWKNWLAPQSEVGCEAVAGYYTLLATTDLYGHDPTAYLTDVLGKLSGNFPQSRLDELLPWNWVDPSAVYGPQPAVKHDAHHSGAEIIELATVRKKLARARAENAAFN